VSDYGCPEASPAEPSRGYPAVSVQYVQSASPDADVVPWTGRLTGGPQLAGPTRIYNSNTVHR
jgi:hypothetical protein